MLAGTGHPRPSRRACERILRFGYAMIGVYAMVGVSPTIQRHHFPSNLFT